MSAAAADDVVLFNEQMRFADEVELAIAEVGAPPRFVHWFSRSATNPLH